MLRRVKHQNVPLSGLLRAAARARKNAYAPYSRFPVGAAVLAGGRIFAACNVENSSYPVAVIAGGSRPAAPCGGCRQVLSEFCAPDAPVIYASTSGRSVTTDVGSLLPDSFGPANLPKPARGRKNPSRR